MTELTNEQRKAIVVALRHIPTCEVDVRYELTWLLARHPEQPANVPEGCTPADARNLREANQQMAQEVHELREALGAINVIRNSIIGLQTLNWSEHVYPLVAALDAAGIEGMDYPEAREFFGAMLDRCNAAEDDAGRYRWLREQNWNESTLFVVAGHHSLVQLGTDCPSRERLDAAIDAARTGASDD